MTRLTLAYHLRAIRDGVPDDAYSTGHPRDGRTNDAYAVDAAVALRTDPVAYLDRVTRDPAHPPQARYDAARLLSRHVLGDDGGYWDTVACPACGEREALFDASRPVDPCRCVTCGVSVPRPA